MITCNHAEAVRLPRWVPRTKTALISRLVHSKGRLLYKSLADTPSALHFVSPSRNDHTVLAIGLGYPGKVVFVRDTSAVVCGSFTAHSGDINRMTAADGLLATAGSDGAVKVWDAARSADGCETPLRLFTGHASVVESCAFDDFHSLLVSSSIDKSVRIWHRSSQEAAFVLHTQDECHQVSFMRGSQHMILAASRAAAQVYDLRMHRSYKRMEAVFSFQEAVSNGFRSDQLHVPTWYMEQQRIDSIWESSHQPVRKRSFFGGSSSRKRQREDMDAGPVMEKPLHEYVDANRSMATQFDPLLRTYIAKFVGHDPSGIVYSAISSPDGRYVLTACTDNTLKLWDAFTGRGLSTLTGANLDLRPIPMFLAEGSVVACASSDGFEESGTRGLMLFWAMPGYQADFIGTGAMDGNAFAAVEVGRRPTKAECYNAHTGMIAYSTHCGRVEILSP